MKVLFIDHYDSFSFNLVDWLVKNCASPGFEVVHRYCDSPELQTIETFDGIVISPGPGNPHDYPATMRTLDQAIGRVPILGVCLGHQMLGRYLNLPLRKRLAPHHGSTVEIAMENRTISVATYHSLTFLNSEALRCPEFMKKACISMLEKASDEIYGFYSTDGAGWLSCQFHPESYLGDDAQFIATEFLKLILKNQRRSCRLNKANALPHEAIIVANASQR